MAAKHLTLLHAWPLTIFIKCNLGGGKVTVSRGPQRSLVEKRPSIRAGIHRDENRHAILAGFSRFGYACASCGDNHPLVREQ